MSTQAEQVVYGGVGSWKPLRLMSGFEFPHALLSNSCWRMREFCSIVGVLGGVVKDFGDHFSMSHAVAS